jgi:hypothetical protein
VSICGGLIAHPLWGVWQVKQLRPFLVMAVEKNGLLLVDTGPSGRNDDIVPVGSENELLAGIVAGVSPSKISSSVGARLADWAICPIPGACA